MIALTTSKSRGSSRRCHRWVDIEPILMLLWCVLLLLTAAAGVVSAQQQDGGLVSTAEEAEQPTNEEAEPSYAVSGLLLL